MNKFLPTSYNKNIYCINYKKLKKEGIKCLLFDLDNTCISYKEKEPTKDFINFLNKLTKNGFKVIIFSNASKKRIMPLLKYKIECNHLSFKPLKINYIKIIKKYNYKKNEVCIIGDQLFTDIYGGNRVGIKTILVDPISNNDLIFTKVLRILERIIIKNATKNGKFIKGEYYD